MLSLIRKIVMLEFGVVLNLNLIVALDAEINMKQKIELELI